MNPETAIAELVRQAAGLDCAAIGRQAFGYAVRLNMRRTGLADAFRYLDLLRSWPEELENLIEDLAVPETWFFRDRGPFACLAQHVRENWMPAHPDGVLRVLSAPCASGEEPYSIAITLLEAGLAPGRFLVDAVDFSRRSLEIARAALFGRNSFREKMDRLPPGYFLAEGDQFRVRGDVAARVAFRQANLRSPSFLAGEAPYDVVFCRNLLIYLVPEARQEVLNHLDRLLAGDGLLFAGHSEVVFFLQNGYVAAPYRRAFACRKAPSATECPTGREADRLACQRARPARLPRRVSSTGRANAPVVDKTAPVSQLALARRLADQGSFDEAAELCGRVLLEGGENAAAHFLLGLIHEARDRLGAAEECFRRALYLEPDHRDALAHMSLLLERKGETGYAGALRERLRRLAAEREASHV
jgi:chemotaxis protein methyltransferase WspC